MRHNLLSGVILSDKEGSVPFRAVDFSRGAIRGKEGLESSLPCCLRGDANSITTTAGVGYCYTRYTPSELEVAPLGDVHCSMVIWQRDRVVRPSRSSFPVDARICDLWLQMQR